MNAGDMNGDGYNDIAVGASQATITSGFVFVFCGGPKIDGVFDAAVGMSSDAGFGASVASVGDINGDGLADIIVGAPAYDFETNKGYWGIFLGDSAIHVTGVHDKPSTPGIFRLLECYPNPFNPTTTLSFVIGHSSFVTLGVYDVLGRVVATLVNEVKPPGEYAVRWNAEGMPSGVYLYRLQAGDFTDTKKLTLIK